MYRNDSENMLLDFDWNVDLYMQVYTVLFFFCDKNKHMQHQFSSTEII